MTKQNVNSNGIQRFPVALLVAVSIVTIAPRSASAQTTSIKRAGTPTDVELRRDAPPLKGNPVLDRSSIIAVREQEPRKFKVNDLLTIIVRVQTQYQADGTANARRQSDLQTQLDAFIKFTGGGVGASAFRRGKPNISYTGTFNQRNDAESEREDRLTTRITGKVIDVKPNGNLVFEAVASMHHDDEQHDMTLTGSCRSTDVSPDNTVLSTQVANLDIDIKTKGNLRNTTRPGWLGTIYDLIRPL